MDERSERAGGSRGPLGVRAGTAEKFRDGARVGSCACAGRGEPGSIGSGDDGDGHGDEQLEVGDDWTYTLGGSKTIER